MTATQGDIHLDTIGTDVDLNGVTVSAQGTAFLDGDITVESGGINFSGSTNVALQDSITLAGGPIDLGSTNNTSVAGSFTLTLTPGAGNAITLDNVDVSMLILTDGATVTLFGDVEVDSNLDFSTIEDGETIILGANASNGANLVTTAENITGTFDLSIDTGSGDATLQAVGTTANLSELSVTSTGTVILNGAVEANDGIDLSGARDVDLAAGSGTFTTTNAAILLNGGAVDGGQAVSITAGTGDVSLGDIGQNVAVDSFTINTAGSTFIGGDIRADSTIAINDDGIVLMTDAHLIAGASITLFDLLGNARALEIDAGTFVDLDAITGVDSLDINAGGLVTIAEAVTANNGVSIVTTGDASILVSADADVTSQGGTIELSAEGDLTISAGAEITNNSGAIALIANSDNTDAEDHNLTISALLSGSPVTLQAIGSLADIILNTVTQSFGGAVTFNGNTNFGVNVTAVDDIVLNGDGTLAIATVILTATNGSIDLNGTVNATADGVEGLTLSALSGTVFAQALGTGMRLGALDIDALGAELGGSITAIGVETTGVGLTTLTADVTVDGTGAIALGDVDGARSLDIDAGDTVALAELDIDSLTVDGGTTVTFGGAVSALGSVQVGETAAPAGAVTVNDSIGAQGDVDLTSATTGTVTVSGEESVAFDAAVTLEDGAVAVSSANGSVTFSGTIDGGQALSVNADDTVTLGGIVGTTALGAFDVTAGTLISTSTRKSWMPPASSLTGPATWERTSPRWRGA